MELLALRLRLNNEKAGEEEKERIEKRIAELEKDLAMD